MATMTEKLSLLKATLGEMDGVLVAFSGGVDSTFLLAVAREVLGERAVASTIRSALNPQSEIDQAARIARQLGARHLIVDVPPLKSEGVVANAPDRCYHCKKVVFSKLREVAEAEGIREVAHAEHVDDMSDYRPGHRASAELGIRAPLAEAGLTKQEIRELSRQMGLEGWDRPSMACLASRIPYGHPITLEALQQIAAAEAAVRELGHKQVRVRHHGTVARVELSPEDLHRAADDQWRREVVRRLKQAGYRYVTLDLEGFRSGSMNEVLTEVGQRG